MGFLRKTPRSFVVPPQFGLPTACRSFVAHISVRCRMLMLEYHEESCVAFEGSPAA
jgi:hypothetical protein